MHQAAGGFNRPPAINDAEPLALPSADQTSDGACVTERRVELECSAGAGRGSVGEVAGANTKLDSRRSKLPLRPFSGNIAQ